MEKSKTPSSYHVGQIRAQLVRGGVPSSTASDLVRMSKTRGEIARDLVAYLKEYRRA